jgi:hypothetical protein
MSAAAASRTLAPALLVLLLLAIVREQARLNVFCGLRHRRHCSGRSVCGAGVIPRALCFAGGPRTPCADVFATMALRMGTH